MIMDRFNFTKKYSCPCGFYFGEIDDKYVQCPKCGEQLEVKNESKF